MPREASKKIPISIYLIDQLPFENQPFEDICGIIIQKINASEASNNHFEEQGLQQDDFGEAQVKIFHAVKTNPPKWQGFFRNVVKKGENLMSRRNTDSSFILFIGYKTMLFGVSGGHGNFALPRFAVANFGMEVLMRLIKIDHKVIKSLQDRGLTGNILGQTRYYRGDQQFSDEDQFGKVYKEVKVDLNREIMINIFGFHKDDLKRRASGCLAKDSFKISKSIDFNTLLKIVGKIEAVLQRERNFSLNKAILISRRIEKDKELIGKLEEQLIAELYMHVKEGSMPNVDFCNKNFEAFLGASAYVVRRRGKIIKEFDDLISLKELIEYFRVEGLLLLESADYFNNSFCLAMLESLDDDGVRLTNGTILDHIHGELLYEGKTFFVIDGEWYMISPDFITDLNKDCKETLDQIWEDKLLPVGFDRTRRERDYNGKYIGKPDTLVFDTITPDNIEFCDILKFDENEIYLIHVKKGFDNSIRELASQVFLSAKRVQRSKKSDYKYFDDVEQRAKNGRNSPDLFLQKIGRQSFPRHGLSSLFSAKRDHQLVFCLAFVDMAKKARSLKDNIGLFESNIAKQSILELRKGLSSLNFRFRIIQIQKEA
jgi:uncharacterized protein (TIGR04141 family)